MSNYWIRFGCFMTGYNYNILRGCSEAAIKSVKKYTAAMVIVCILWFFIGFTFAQRYLVSNIAGCVLAGIISVVIIVQVEKQIILSINPGWRLYVFRFLLALMMSLLGAAIIDQILLKKDIELEKISYITERVNQILPVKTAELEKQIAALDTTINNKEAEKQQYISDCARQPTIMIVSSETRSTLMPQKVIGASGRDSIVYKSVPATTIIRNPMPNPKMALIAPLDSTIGVLRQQKAYKENDLLHIRPALEKEMQEKTGFLDELKVMVQLIRGSKEALLFWLLWICFFLFIEMLVLVGKIVDKTSDYEKTVLHHMHLQIWRLEALSKELRPEVQRN